MNLKDYFDTLTLSDVKDFVTNKETESLVLEFKISDEKADNKNFSKCLSGFSNSIGGIIVWGIKASPNESGIDAAKEYRPILSLKKFENHLKRIEGTAIAPSIKGIEYKTIEETDDSGYLIVYIPESDRAPHMALYSEKHYFKRSGDSFYICEHFDILDMFNRRSKPMGIVEVLSDQVTVQYDQRGYFEYKGILCIKNTGKVVLKNVMLEIVICPPYLISPYGLDGNMNRGMEIYRNFTSPNLKYIGRNNLVIHPNTYHEIDKVVLNEHGGSYPLCELKIEYKLYADEMEMQNGQIIKQIENFAVIK